MPTKSASAHNKNEKRAKRKRTKQQKQEINDTHCCICFKLRTAILICICISIILILAYGYKYWIDFPSFSSRLVSPEKFYGYASVIGVELLLSILGWIGVYIHIRFLTKLYTYWVIVHILIIVMVFWASTLFDYLHFGFFIGWTVIQVILLFLLWRFKELLKITYGWSEDDDEEESEEDSQPQKTEQLETNENDQNKSSVNVSINLTMPQQQQQQVYQQPQAMIPMQYNMMQQPIYNPYPQMQPAPLPISPHSSQGDLSTHADQRNIVSNIPNKTAQVQQQANVRIPVHENGDDRAANRQITYSQEEKEMQQIQAVSNNYVKADNPEAIKPLMSMSESTENETLYDTPERRQTNDMPPPNQDVEGFIIHGEDTRNADVQAVVERQKAALQQGRARRKTPDPPPAPVSVPVKNMDIINEMQAAAAYGALADDDDVLKDDFIAEIQPDMQKKETPMNLYFLDPGDKVTGGYNNQ